MGSLISIDFKTLRFSNFDFSHAPEPDGQIQFISQEAVTISDICIELRSPEETSNPAFHHAIRLSPQDIKNVGFSIDKRIIVCCKTGMRAWQSARTLQSMGYKSVYVYAAEPYE